MSQVHQLLKILKFQAQDPQYYLRSQRPYADLRFRGILFWLTGLKVENTSKRGENISCINTYVDQQQACVEPQRWVERVSCIGFGVTQWLHDKFYTHKNTFYLKIYT